MTATSEKLPVKSLPERQAFSARLIEALHANGQPANATHLAREFNHRYAGKPVTVGAARKWLVAESMPTQEKLRALAAWLNVAPDWLRFGARTMELSSAPAYDVESPRAMLLRALSVLPIKDRLLVADFVQLLSTQLKPKVRQAPVQPAANRLLPRT